MSENPMIRKFHIYGIVQGVGFRPTVARHAASCGITGTVSNRGPFVEVLAAGTEAQLAAFRSLLLQQPPKRATILKLTTLPLSEEEKQLHFPDFRIVESAKTTGEIFVSPDIAMCPECEAELMDPQNRRYLHPFINCTCCGPRLSILDSLPYDRERTSMKHFPMCQDCAREYQDPADRRYDAQPVCCPHCGPALYLLGQPEVRGEEALRQTRRVIREGGIVAVKGIGGFHLCCDATSEEAVRRLRERKHRPAKPFAVMARNLTAAEDICRIDRQERETLTGHQKPILLLRKRDNARIAPSVAPDNPYLGVMLPYAPVQRLLFDYCHPGAPQAKLSLSPDDFPDVLIMTSGNHAGAPICRDDESAAQELSGIADLILSNNRDIRMRADDSVLQYFRGEPLMLRRSRGYAPLPYLVSAAAAEDNACASAAGSKRQVLAIGGELKNTFCFGVGDLFYPGSYVGDLTDLRTCDALRESVQRMETLLEAKPAVIACDLHPRYNSTAVAEEIAEARNLPLLRIQHHYAHIVSCMAENDHPQPVIGIALDGTGYGTDGSIWGGEMLITDYRHFRRAASIKPFLQIGGDTASREGWRIAVSMIYSLEKAANRLDSDIGGFVARSRTEEIVRQLGLADQNTLRAQFMLHDRNLNAITSTSCGRLFDAVSALLGIRLQSSYEGEGAVQLMYQAMAADPVRAVALLPEFESFLRQMLQREEAFGQSSVEDEAIWEDTDAAAANELDAEADRLIVRTDLLFRFLLEKRLALTTSNRRDSSEDNAFGLQELAYFFHEGLALLLTEAAVQLSAENEVDTAALSGGSFQNTLLLGLMEDKLKARGLKVLKHRLIPANDGGIGLGQAVVARWAE